MTGGLLSAPLAAEAEPTGKVYTVGTLGLGFRNPDPGQDWLHPFLEAMRELGYAEGRNLVVKRVSASGRPDRLNGLAAELVRAKVDVILTSPGSLTGDGLRELEAATKALRISLLVLTVHGPEDFEPVLIQGLCLPSTGPETTSTRVG